MNQIISDTPRIVEFVRQFYHIDRSDGQQSLGLVRDGELIAGVIYENWTNHNIFMSVAAKPNSNWLSRTFLRLSFDYPFNQLGCSRVSTWTEQSNTRSIKFTEHLGFKVEATLSGVARDGGDVNIYCMRKEECKYV